MAALTEFTCSHCHFRIESWSDGKPYLRGSDGQRHYFFHPCEPDAWEERFLIVVKCLADDAFIITAYLTDPCCLKSK